MVHMSDPCVGYRAQRVDQHRRVLHDQVCLCQALQGAVETRMDDCPGVMSVWLCACCGFSCQHCLWYPPHAANLRVMTAPCFAPSSVGKLLLLR